MVKKKFTTEDKIKIAELYIHNEPGSLLYRLIGADAHIRPYEVVRWLRSLIVH